MIRTGCFVWGSTGITQTKDNPVPDFSAIMQSRNLYLYCLNNPLRYNDPNGESVIVTCIIVGVAVGIVTGAILGAVISYNKYQKVKWQYVVAGAAIGATAGGVLGAGAGIALEAIGITAAGTIGTTLYTTLEQGVNFTKTTVQRMTDPARFVPVQILIDAIKYGTPVLDPQMTTKALMYTTEMLRLVKVGSEWVYKAYTLEVLYDEVTNTILHFMYY